MHIQGITRGNSINEFEIEMEYGAHLADYLGLWILGIDFQFGQNCSNIVKSENCELKVL
jgi:hypothetical protein